MLVNCVIVLLLYFKLIFIIQVVNRHLLNDLIKLNLWNEDMRNELIYYKGSVQVKTNHFENNLMNGIYT